MSLIRVQSLRCSWSPTFESISVPCSSCQTLGTFVDVVKDHAAKAVEKLDRLSLSHNQLLQKLDAVEKQAQVERLKHLNTTRALDSLRTHEATWHALLDLVGNHDIPGLHRIFKIAKRRSWSTEKLLERLRDAFDGSYHVRGYSDMELDLATAIYELM